MRTVTYVDAALLSSTPDEERSTGVLYLRPQQKPVSSLESAWPAPQSYRVTAAAKEDLIFEHDSNLFLVPEPAASNNEMFYAGDLINSPVHPQTHVSGAYYGYPSHPAHGPPQFIPPNVLNAHVLNLDPIYGIHELSPDAYAASRPLLNAYGSLSNAHVAPRPLSGDFLQNAGHADGTQTHVTPQDGPAQSFGIPPSDAAYGEGIVPSYLSIAGHQQPAAACGWELGFESEDEADDVAGPSFPQQTRGGKRNGQAGGAVTGRKARLSARARAQLERHYDGCCKSDESEDSRHRHEHALTHIMNMHPDQRDEVTLSVCPAYAKGGCKDHGGRANALTRNEKKSKGHMLTCKAYTEDPVLRAAHPKPLVRTVRQIREAKQAIGKWNPEGKLRGGPDVVARARGHAESHDAAAIPSFLQAEAGPSRLPRTRRGRRATRASAALSPSAFAPLPPLLPSPGQASSGPRGPGDSVQREPLNIDRRPGPDRRTKARSAKATPL